MNVAIASIHRNNVWRLRRYFKQVTRLRDLLREQGHHLRVIAVEGDSTDDTHGELITHSRINHIDTTVITHNHGRPDYGSCEEPDRLRSLSAVLNSAMDGVLPTDDEVVYVESDLIWTPSAISRLIDTRRASRYDILSPLVMAGDLFYDIWGYRDLNGNRFTNGPPFHPSLNGIQMELSSVGSCVAMSGDVARDTRVRDDYAFVGWCRDARSHGYRIAVDPSITVRHPA